MAGSAQGTFVPEDFVTAARVVYRKAQVRRFVLGGLALVASLVAWELTGQGALAFLSAALLLFFVYDYFLGVPSRIQRRLRTWPACREVSEIGWDADGLTAKNSTGAGTELWSGFKCAFDVPSAFILLGHGGAYSVIPKRWLGSLEAEADLRAALAPLLATKRK